MIWYFALLSHHLLTYWKWEPSEHIWVTFLSPNLNIHYVLVIELCMIVSIIMIYFMFEWYDTINASIY